MEKGKSKDAKGKGEKKEECPPFTSCTSVTLRTHLRPSKIGYWYLYKGLDVASRYSEGADASLKQLKLLVSGGK